MVVAGLGNPGREYAATRHNVGFRVAELLAERAGASRWETRFEALVMRVALGQKDVLLVKPITFMNLSGKAVGAAVRFYKTPLDELVVVHDDIDLDVGRLKIQQGGNDGGHRGLMSLAETFGGLDFVRLRLGVGRPTGDAVDHVLTEFLPQEHEAVVAMIEKAARAVEDIALLGLTAALNRFNRRARPKKAALPKQEAGAQEDPEETTSDQSESVGDKS